jgi:hypothetical protein
MTAAAAAACHKSCFMHPHRQRSVHCAQQHPPTLPPKGGPTHQTLLHLCTQWQPTPFAISARHNLAAAGSEVLAKSPVCAAAAKHHVPLKGTVTPKAHGYFCSTLCDALMDEQNRRTCILWLKVISCTSSPASMIALLSPVFATVSSHPDSTAMVNVVPAGNTSSSSRKFGLGGHYTTLPSPMDSVSMVST